MARQTKEELAATKKKHYEANKERLNALSREYYKNNKEAIQANKKKYYEKNRESILAYNKEYREENRDKINLKLKEYYQENKDRFKDYQKLNRGKVNSIAAKRRASKKDRTPSWLTKDHLTQIEELYWLAKDLKAVSGEEYHVDHIVPLQGNNVSGLHVPWNLQILPRDLNISKGNLLED